MNYVSWLVGLMLFSAVVISLGAGVYVNIAEEYPVSYDAGATETFNKLKNISVISDDIAGKVVGDSSIGSESTIDKLWGGAWGALKLVGNSITVGSDITTETLGLVGVDDSTKRIWVTTFATIITLVVMGSILYMVFGRKPG